VVVEGGGERRLVTAPSPEVSVLGLKNGTPYAFQVFAVSANGRSEGSEVVTATPTTGMEGVVAGVIVEFAETVQVAEGSRSVPGDDRITAVDLSVAEKVTDDAVLVEFSEPVDLDTAEQIATDLAADELVEWAEPDQFFFTSTDTSSGTEASSGTETSSSDLAQTVSVPTDSDYATSQWNLWDTYGISVGDGATAMTDAWAGPRGDGVTVAVIDTGITPHPDLDGQLVSGYDFVSNPEQLASSRQANAPPVAFDGDYVDEATYGSLGRDANPTDPGDWRGVAPVRDSSWHGTKIAGLIAAQANDDFITGIAPNAKIQPVRALSWRGGLLSDIAASITWASGGKIDDVPDNANPSKVINMSFAVETMCPTALQQAIDGAIERGSILVAAAGNANDDASKFAPGNCNGVITVAATNRDGNKADYSNYGTVIDIAAPGGDAANPITTTSNTGSQTLDQPSTAGDFGTSIAAAHVSAAAAILASRNASLTPSDAYTQLTGDNFTKVFNNETCDAANPAYSCGTGILSLALAEIASGACAPSGSTYKSGITTYRVVQFTTSGDCAWTTPTGINTLDALVVGGGGGAGGAIGGGGGGGRVVSTPISVSPGTSIAVTVGSGGVGGEWGGRQATNGGQSKFGSQTAPGGGAGGTSDTTWSGSSGGSGGGGSCQEIQDPRARGDASSASPVPGSGNSGGQGPSGSGSACTAGGGGGAGAAGQDANTNGSESGGNGGNGIADGITGASVFYGGGGGGGVNGSPPVGSTVPLSSGAPGAGGAGGGGNAAAKGRFTQPNGQGSPTDQNGIGLNGNPGGVNTGGGGGGASNWALGGNGGSGIVIVRYVIKVDELALKVEPVGTPVAGNDFDVKVTLIDEFGNPVENSGANGTVALTLGDGAGILTGTLTGTIPDGSSSVTISGVTYTKAESGVELIATGTGAGSLVDDTEGVSAPFTVTHGAAASIAVSAGDGQSAVVDTTVATAPSVIVKDAFDNPVQGTAVTFAVATGGGSVTGESATTNSSGIAAVGSWKLGTTTGSNTLTATSGSLSGSPVTFSATGTPGAVSGLAFTVGPSDVVAGVGISPAVQVSVQDSFGNTVTDATNSITLAIGTNPGSGTLSGTVVASAVNRCGVGVGLEH
jgi:subtilisin family serine protease